MTAIRAMFVEFQQVKTRGCYKLVFEVDEAQADQALQALGGLPQGKESRWCSIALLGPAVAPADQAEPRREGEGRSQDKPKRRFHELSRREQAVLLCKDERFRYWLSTQTNCGPWDEEDAATWLRAHCAVTSRADLGDNEGGYQFDRIHAQYLADTGQAAEPR